MTFRARLILAYFILWALLLALAVGVAYYRITSGLYQQTEATLLADTERLAKLYASGKPGNAPPSAGNVEIAFYLPDGTPIDPKEPLHRLPPGAFSQASETPKSLRDNSVLTVFRLVPGTMVIALSLDIQYIEQLSRSVAVGLLGSLALLLPLGALLMVFAGRLALAPLEHAVQNVKSRSPNNLEPLPYRGPDDELGQIVAQVNSLLEALREAQARERAFLAEVSHELRTPLTALTGYLERLSRHPDEPGSLEGARRTALHLTRLVGDLIALARGEVERSVNAHIVDLGALLRQAVQEYPGVSLVFAGGNPGHGAHETEVLGDPDRLLQLARNLISNAVRAAGRPDSVKVLLEASPTTVVFSVLDDGPGISPEVLPRLFRRFARGPEGGTGLGLAIAKQVAEAHGGTIQVASRPGETRFSVSLPRLTEEEP